MNVEELAMMAGRAAVIYVFLLALVRVLGKRTIGDLSAFDFIVAMLIAELIDEPINGKEPMLKGIVAILTVSALHYLNGYLSYKSTMIHRLTGGVPRVLVRNGRIDEHAMAREHVGEDKLWEMLREAKIDNIGDVSRATLEPSGQLSVIKTYKAKEADKHDLDALGTSQH